MSELTEKTALITGSSRGIGFSIAKRFHEAGCTIILNGRNADALTKARDDLGLDRCNIANGDVSDPKQAQQIADYIKNEFGKLDILVCNVGSGASVPPGKETAKEWHRVFATNLWSTTNIVESCQQLITRETGSIVCISSICGEEVIQGAPITYSAAKAALNAYVRGIARPLGKEGIRINAIAPGNILFDGSVWHRKMNENADIVQDMLAREVALARLGTPEEIANLALWLASPQATFATGQIWTLDGGQTHR